LLITGEYMNYSHRPAPYRTSLLCSILAVFLALIFPAAAFAQSAQSDAASWEEMIKREKIALNSLEANVRIYIAAQPERIGKIHEKTQQLNQELMRLSITYNMLEPNPIEMRDILRQMAILGEQGATMVAPINEEHKAISELRKTLAGHQAEYESLAREESLQEARQAAAAHAVDIKKAIALLSAAAGIADIIPNAVEEFTVRLESRKKLVENDLRTAWKRYYLFPPTSTFFAASTWKTLSVITINLSGFWHYWLIPYTQNRAVIGKTLGRTFLCAAGMIVLFLAVFVHIRRKYRPIPAGRFLVFGIYTAFGVPLMVLGTATGTGILATVSFIAEIVLAAGLVSLGWKLRKIFGDGLVYRHNPLWPAWCMFAAGTVAQVVHTPTIIYSLPMALIFMIAGIYSFFMKKADQNDLDKRLFLVNSWFSLAFIVLTFFGLCGIAVLAATAWFAVAVNVELWSGLAGWMKRTIEAGMQNMTTARRIATGALFPMVFLGLFSVTIIWIILYIGGTPLLNDMIRWHLNVGYVSLNIPMLIVVIAVLVITRSLVIVVNTLITLIATRLGGGGLLREGVIKSLHAIATYVIWSLSILLSLKLVGVSVTHLAIVAGGLSIGAGFGLQELIKNFFSGLILLFGRSIHPGDEIQLGDIRGTVIRVNIRNTIMQTNEDSTIFIPNSDLINKNIVNWTYRDPKGRAEIAVAVAYGSSTELVRDVLIRCAELNPGVLGDPPPYVLFWDFGDNALAFRLRFWIRRPVQMRDKIASAIRFEVEKAFRENNIEMAYPQQDVHIRSAEGLEPYLKP
jgi:potassium-dependent mechanosensitive channel